MFDNVRFDTAEDERQANDSARRQNASDALGLKIIIVAFITCVIIAVSFSPAQAQYAPRHAPTPQDEYYCGLGRYIVEYKTVYAYRDGVEVNEEFRKGWKILDAYGGGDYEYQPMVLCGDRDE